MTTLEAIIIAIVEGLTEFLPISSTGHMIVTERLLGVESTDFTKLFTVGIQLGAILAVIVLYWKKFVAPLKTGNWQFYFKLFIAVIPALLLGFIFSGSIYQGMLTFIPPKSPILGCRKSSFIGSFLQAEMQTVKLLTTIIPTTKYRPIILTPYSEK